MTRFLFSCVLVVAAACSDDGIGAPCNPTVPCSADGSNCGFNVRESYVVKDTTGCTSGQVCLVHHLDNGTDGKLLANPNSRCTSTGAADGCLTDQAIERSVYCSCPCGRSGSEDRAGLCTCGDGFACEQVEGDGTMYCVRTPG